MGRGRQKAKQTKVARELKYYSPETNYAQLERELSGRGVLRTKGEESVEPYAPGDDEDDPYAQWAWDDQGDQDTAGPPQKR
jgi:hypothetical protein